MSKNLKIPSPPSYFLLGHLPYLSKGKGGCFFESLRDLSDKYGDIYELSIGPQKWVVISDAEYTQQVFVKDFKSFPKGKTLNEAKSLGMGTTALTVSEGEDWKEKHRIFMRYFNKKTVLATNGIGNMVADKAIDYLRHHPEGELLDFMNRVAFAFITKVSCDYDSSVLSIDRKRDPFFENQFFIVEQFMNRIKRTPAWKYLPIPDNFKLKKVFKEHKKFLTQIIDDYKKNPDRNENVILFDLLESIDDMTVLIDQVWTIIGGGFESTGSSLQWLFYELSRSPEDLRIIQNELNALGDIKEIGDQEILKCPHLKNAVKENLRLNNTFGFIARECINDYDLQGYTIKKGTFLFSLYGKILTHPKYWGEDARVFRPSRFNEKDYQDLPPGVYQPFGYGPRKCVGEKMSIHEQELIAARILREFTPVLKENQEIIPYQSFTKITKNGIFMRFIPN